MLELEHASIGFAIFTHLIAHGKQNNVTLVFKVKGQNANHLIMKSRKPVIVEGDFDIYSNIINHGCENLTLNFKFRGYGHMYKWPIRSKPFTNQQNCRNWHFTYKIKSFDLYF